MYKTINRDLEKRHVMSSMIGLMQSLEQLAPHPETPNYRGAMFVNLPGWCKAPGQHDALAGMLVIDMMMGGAISGAMESSTAGSLSASDAAQLSNLASTAIAAYETYMGETEEERKHKAAHGQGTFARMSKTSISGRFNQRAGMTAELQAFMNDMPERIKIENQLFSYLKKLKALDAPVYEPVQAPAPAYRYAA